MKNKKEMRTFVIGDIHGAYLALVQCLERSGFDIDIDQLIVLGDVVDGWPQTRECIDTLLTIKNLIYVKGNHDVWFQEWDISGIKETIWTRQGGAATISSYTSEHNSVYIPESHLDLMVNAPYYYIDNKNRVFVHGGFDWHKPVEEETIDNLMWDRDLYFFMKRQHSSKSYKKYSLYDEIYIGHTQTNSLKPDMYCNLINMDTGAGWNGCVSIMNVDTKEYWSSDVATRLYDGNHRRY